jgi:predicted dehydrogenase
MNQLKIGAIGSGYWGPNLIRNFIELPTTEMAAVADLDAGRLTEMRKRHPQIPHLTQDYRALFDLGLDGVVISTPPETHHAIVRDCLENGLHVLVEKPLTTDLSSAEDLEAVAARNNRVLMVGHTFEYNAAVRKLKQMMDDGEAGDIRYIDAVRVGLGLFHPSLNVVWDLAPHDISILIYLLGEEPSSVSARGIACVQDSIEDVAYLTLRFPSGILAHMRLSWLDPMKTRRVTVVGSKKMVVYDDVALDEKIKVYDKRVDAMPRTDTFGAFQFTYHHGGIVSPPIDFVEPLRVECAHFVECIREGIRPLTDAASGIRVVKVIEAAQRSIEMDGSPVSIDGRATSKNTLKWKDRQRSASGGAAR